MYVYSSIGCTTGTQPYNVLQNIISTNQEVKTKDD